uniref:Uncharacterized protein n=1 Tax=Lepeophtheirus salmonis TaxID=72036 RepID=A0A0K2VBW5_LEPSM
MDSRSIKMCCCSFIYKCVVGERGAGSGACFCKVIVSNYYI